MLVHLRNDVPTDGIDQIIIKTSYIGTSRHNDVSSMSNFDKIFVKKYVSDEKTKQVWNYFYRGHFVTFKLQHVTANHNGNIKITPRTILAIQNWPQKYYTRS